jgi:hypothetical protein
MKKLILSILVLAITSCTTDVTTIDVTPHTVLVSSGYQFSATLNSEIILTNGFSVTRTVNSGDVIVASNPNGKRMYVYLDGKSVLNNNSLLYYIVP